MPRISAPSTVAEHRQQVQMEVFAAWAKLIAERGYDGVSLADVAAEAGVGRTAMYNYFADKESLLLAYASWQMDTFLVSCRPTSRRRTRPRTSCARSSAATSWTSRPARCCRARSSPRWWATRRTPRLPATSRRSRTACAGSSTQGIASGEFTVAESGPAATMAIACIGAERIPLGMGVHALDESVEQVFQFLSGALGAVPPALPRSSTKGKMPGTRT